MIVINKIIFLFSCIVQVGIKAPGLEGPVFATSFPIVTAIIVHHRH